MFDRIAGKIKSKINKRSKNKKAATKDAVINVAENKSKVKMYFNTGLPPLEQNTEKIYDDFYSDTEALEAYYEEKRLAFYKKVVSVIKNRNIDINCKKILDVGCGNGHLLKEIELNFRDCSLHGCDFSKPGIDYAKTLFPEINFFKHNIYEKIEDDFDVIICTEVLEHLEYPEVAIKNIVEALTLNGIALLTVPDGRKDNIEEHINFWSPESWHFFIKRECKNLEFKTDVFDGHNLAEIIKTHNFI